MGILEIRYPNLCCINNFVRQLFAGEWFIEIYVGDLRLIKEHVDFSEGEVCDETGSYYGDKSTQVCALR